MLTKTEKQIIKSLVKYHIKHMKKDKKVEDIISIIGAEAKYEKALKEILKKL